MNGDDVIRYIEDNWSRLVKDFLDVNDEEFQIFCSAKLAEELQEKAEGGHE